MSFESPSPIAAPPPKPHGTLAEPVLGNCFVAAYPPFSAWTRVRSPVFHDALGRRPASAPLGLQVHLAFCYHKCDAADLIKDFQQTLAAESGAT